ncbi:alkaline phosphatase PhoX [Kribbella sp. NPDC051587]|uniref:alkaline phosphatase PhoX n=1 Tax=Kribbella sp. NPDC051587 TaxID=3364119 RepID=UPI0037917F7E
MCDPIHLQEASAVSVDSNSNSLSRRRFVAGVAASGAAVSVLGSVEALYTAEPALGTSGPKAGYGPLVADPAGMLDLPRGFRYQVLSREGLTRADGGLIPSRFDGMGVFPDRDGASRLVRNHECLPDAPVPVRGPAEWTYDPAAGGGNSTLLVDKRNHVTTEFISLGGTAINCSGGRTPWRTWLTCEETEDKAGEKGYTKDHGFIFEVDPYDGRRNRDPVPLKAMGRFQHEAVAVDPATGVVYETEDAFLPPLGGFYRFLPNRPRGGWGSLRAGGELQAMRIPDLPDLSVVQDAGTVFDHVEWVSVPDPLATSESVRTQDFSVPITGGYKLEGCWWGAVDRCVYFVSSFALTELGPKVAHNGQVWKFDPRRKTLRLEMIFTRKNPPDPDPEFDSPDNITMSPYGGLMMCEDGVGEQHILGTTEDGDVFKFAKNRVDIGTPESPEYGEFTGAGFSADGQTMFFNLWMPGVTYAVTGPWRRRR